MEMIKTENVSYSYDVWIKDVKHKREALHGINLDIHKGEFVAILGANGSGKSTLAKHFNVLLQPDEGRVLVNGRSTEDKDAVWEIRSTVGMVFQNPDNQIIGSSVEEDVAFGLENRKVPSCEIRSKVADSLKAVGLFTNRKFSPSKLSGGQKQRVAIAGIIALDSNCIVLDEPTSMLDPLSRKELMDVLVKLHRQGRTIVLITHHTDEAALAERIVIMNNGNVTAEGTPEEIFNKPSVLYV
jgi:energy-coupling factor transporter ATPase